MELEIKEQHYVSWQFPSHSDGFAMEVDKPEVSALKVPPGAYAFTFFKIFYTEAKIDGKTIMLQSSKITDETIKHYLYGAKEYTVDQVEDEMGDPRSANQWRKQDVEKVARTRFGSLIAIDDTIKCLDLLPEQEMTPEEFKKWIEDENAKYGKKKDPEEELEEIDAKSEEKDAKSEEKEEATAE